MSRENLREIKVDDPKPEVLDLLRSVTERAEAGEVIGLIVIELERECEVTVECTGNLEVRDAYFGLRKAGIILDAMTFGVALGGGG